VFESHGPQSDMKTITLTCNTILKGKWYNAGEPIERSLVPPNLRPYEAKEEKESAEPKKINLRRNYNQPYSVDADGFLRSPVRRQIAEMQAEAEEKDAIEEEIAEAPLNETVAAALEEARDADVHRQIANAKVAAEHMDQVEDAVRPEQDERTANGEFDVLEKPKRQVSSKAFVKRYGRFVLAATVDLVPGESLFRFRPRSMGGFGKIHRLF
jgi:hypothetical protein